MTEAHKSHPYALWPRAILIEMYCFIGISSTVGFYYLTSSNIYARALNSDWAASCKKVHNGLSRCRTKRTMGAHAHPYLRRWNRGCNIPISKNWCYTKRRAGAATRSHPSFALTPTQDIRDLFWKHNHFMSIMLRWWSGNMGSIYLQWSKKVNGPGNMGSIYLHRACKGKFYSLFLGR